VTFEESRSQFTVNWGVNEKLKMKVGMMTEIFDDE
jgi:hypothetical protein